MKANLLNYRKTNIFILISLVIILLVGILIGINPQYAIYIIGLIGIIGYIFLCITRPFVAFGLLVALGLTVWLSSIPLIGGFSVLVGVGLVFTGIWVSRLLLRNGRFLWMREFWLIIVLLAVLGISTALNWGGPAGFTGVITYLQLLLFTVLVVNFADNSDRLRKLGYIFVFTSTLLALMILLDYAHLLPVGVIKNTVGGVIIDGSIDTFERSGGIWGDPNFTALQLIVGLPFILEFWGESGYRQKIMLAISSVMILWALVLTYSMGGLVGLATILLLKTFYAGRRNVVVAVFQVALLAIIGWWLAFNVLPKYYLERIWVNFDLFSRFFNSFDTSLFLHLGTTRGDTWSAAFNTFLQSPIWGHGPGNAIFLNPMNSTFRMYRLTLGAHNFLLSVANDIGIIGLVFFMALLVLSLRASWPRQSEQFPVRNAVFIALLASIIQGLGIDMQTQKLLWILIGMALAIKLTSSKKQIKQD